MQIGEFAKLCGTNISVLRYYDKIGLLSPAFTDVVTGYRYYAPGQERVFRTITMLGDAGFSLKEIGQMLANVGNEEALSAAFAAKRTEIAEKLRALAEVESYMKGMNEMKEEELEFNESLAFPFVDDPAAVGKWTVLG
nr:MerR family transcriptional regulator [Clostridia bacterium]